MSAKIAKKQESGLNDIAVSDVERNRLKTSVPGLTPKQEDEKPKSGIPYPKATEPPQTAGPSEYNPKHEARGSTEAAPYKPSKGLVPPTQ